MDTLQLHSCSSDLLPPMQISSNGSLIVCLCDVSAEDMVALFSGVPLHLCRNHGNAVKLQSLMQVNCSLRFHHVDERGDFRSQTLAEGIVAVQKKV